MRFRTFIILFFICAVTGCATQQDFTSLDERLLNIEKMNAALYKKSLELESRMNATEKAQVQNIDGLRKSFAGQRVDINELRENIQMINGKHEETEYLLKRKIKKLENRYENKENQLQSIKFKVDSNQDRLFRIEQYLNFESVESNHTIVPDSTIKTAQTPVKELSDIEMYNDAKRAFDRGVFETAREEFQRLIKKYPKSKQADNAQFWIGETYYREKWYEKAILEYQKVIEKYPKGNKVAAALLKQGFAFFSLKDKANARLILTELIKKYPDTNESKIARKKLKTLSK